MKTDKLSLAALMAANAFEKAKAKRRNIPYTPFAPTKSQLEDWKEVVLAVRATDHSQPEPPSPWRGIESAPRDGTPILCVKKGDGFQPEILHFEDGVFGWLTDDMGFGFHPNRQPTHWMPLQEPPR